VFHLDRIRGQRQHKDIPRNHGREVDPPECVKDKQRRTYKNAEIEK
jgi:hypothetical protein